MTDSTRLTTLDGLRGLAAIAVVLLHGSELFLLSWVPHNAYLAVDFFFLLSGYVLARGFERKLRQGWATDFLRRRLIRLYPLVIAGSLIGFVIGCKYSATDHPPAMQEAVIDLFSSILLIPTPPIVSCEWQMYPTNLPLWSLFYELAVNAVYALIAPFLTNRRLIGLIVLSALVLWLAIRTYNNADFALSHFELGGSRVSFSFFLGVGIYRAFEVLPITLRLPRRYLAVIFVVLAAALLSLRL